MMCYHLFGCKANLGTILTIDIYFLVSVLTPDLFASGDFRRKSPSWLKILKLLSFYSGNFKIFKNALGQFISNRPPKNVITSTILAVAQHIICNMNFIQTTMEWH